MPPFATLYTTHTFLHARVTKSLAAANLNNLDIHIPTTFQYGITNKAPEYLAKFPHGKIPALETPSGFYLSEGSAIALFLSESGPKREQLLGRSTEKRALVQMWVSFADSELFSNSGAVLEPIMGTKPYNATYIEEKEGMFIHALKRLEHHLAQDGKVWLVRDDELSLADLSVAAAMLWPLKFFMDGEYRGSYPKTMEWWERLMRVDEVTRAFNAPVPLCEKRAPNDGSFVKRTA
ncbi:glutathione S-transferase [Lophiotrema nucula]|uniref:Glutathione S-transferase n=1 Tax=Lophiotrema nucula TaxID=690887 RepID=A0A6A5YQL8_9PLEO|nr:glutathione S-transferase [Lophiotrema nucula]